MKITNTIRAAAGLLAVTTVEIALLVTAIVLSIKVYDAEYPVETIIIGTMIFITLMYTIDVTTEYGANFVLDRHLNIDNGKKTDHIMSYMNGYPVYTISLILDGPSNDFTFTIKMLSNDKVIQIDVSPLRVNKKHYIPLPRTALVLSRSEVANAIGNSIYNNALPIIDDDKEYDDTVAYISITDTPKKVS